MVISNPTSNINRAARARLSPMIPAELSTNVWIEPVARITSAKPAAAIMMKPIIAIIFMPSVNTSSASSQRTTPEREKMTKPVSAPIIIESSHNCTTKAATTATRATSSERPLEPLPSRSTSATAATS